MAAGCKPRWRGAELPFLPRAELAGMELPIYPGLDLKDIYLVASHGDARDAMTHLLACDAVGFDTESKPTFRKGEISTGPHLVQLASDSRVFLFPTCHLDTLEDLRLILESPQLLKVGMGLGNDRTALQARLGISLNNVLDMGEVLRGPSHRGTVGAKVAVAHFFGQRLVKSKKIGTSNWAHPRLSEPQLRYAANDAHVALRIYRAWKREQSRPNPTPEFHHDPVSPDPIDH